MGLAISVRERKRGSYMKYVLLVLFMGSVSFASSDSLLNECKISCSSRCMDYAQSLKAEAEEVIDGCNSGSSGGEIVEACTKAGFSYQSDVQTCIKNAGSGDAVRACASAGFSYQSQIQTCISDMGSKDSDIVDACKSAGFSYQADILKCIDVARSASTVNACAKAGFSYQSQILDCAAK